MKPAVGVPSIAREKSPSLASPNIAAGRFLLAMALTLALNVVAYGAGAGPSRPRASRRRRTAPPRWLPRPTFARSRTDGLSRRVT